MSRAVRAGCDVVEKAVRRGFGLGRDPSGPPWMPPWMAPMSAMAPWTGGPAAGPWTTGQWVDAMTSAAAQWATWIDGWSQMARSVVGAAEPGGWAPGTSPLASRLGSLASTPPAPSPSHAGATGAVRVTLELRTARAVTVELDLGSSGPPPSAGTALEIHGLLAPAATAAPPITDIALAVTDDTVRVALGSIEQHPPGVYAGAVLAAGRACGTLTVRLV